MIRPFEPLLSLVGKFFVTACFSLQTSLNDNVLNNAPPAIMTQFSPSPSTNFGFWVLDIALSVFGFMFTQLEETRLSSQVWPASRSTMLKYIDNQHRSIAYNFNCHCHNKGQQKRERKHLLTRYTDMDHYYTCTWKKIKGHQAAVCFVGINPVASQ